MTAPVFLNVYDLTANNSYTYWCGVGIFHAGVEVYNEEYAFGGHEFDYTGVFVTRPKDAPGQVIFRDQVYVGETNLSRQEVHELIQKMGRDYKGNRYHLLQRNCNHFASDLVYQLTGRPAPGWVNRLAGIAVALHCLLPTTWVPPLINPDSRQTLLDAGATRSDRYLIDDSEHYSTSAQHTSTLVSPPTMAPAPSLLANRA